MTMREAVNIMQDAHYNALSIQYAECPLWSVQYAGCPLKCVKHSICLMPITMREAFNMLDAHYNV